MDYIQKAKTELKSMGFNVNNMTDDQVKIVIEPIFAPENYMCDGKCKHRIFNGLKQKK